eukprot:TRINITY_DN3842_c1_g3_i1.p1 TRINITY_DN3842_c1_g3~~TRINITY_DN3842_c1_g3_i1.p1  ORF type:complete len:984 (+),score=205.17 TRINITY_DN3842_c1_g3_i1:83-3034(+)
MPSSKQPNGGQESWHMMLTRQQQGERRCRACRHDCSQAVPRGQRQPLQIRGGLLGDGGCSGRRSLQRCRQSLLPSALRWLLASCWLRVVVRCADAGNVNPLPSAAANPASSLANPIGLENGKLPAMLGIPPGNLANGAAGGKLQKLLGLPPGSLDKLGGGTFPPMLGMPASEQYKQLVQKNADRLLTPEQPQAVRVKMGGMDFVPFSCEGGLANVVLTLKTYTQKHEPLLVVSLNSGHPDPTHSQDVTSMDKWKEDAAGDHYVVVKGVGPEGGVVAIVNMKIFAGEALLGSLTLSCSFIVAFDPLFLDALMKPQVCPNGITEDPDVLCSGHGRCDVTGKCACHSGWLGSACEKSLTMLTVAGHDEAAAYDIFLENGRWHYFSVRIPDNFPGGYVRFTVEAGIPLVVVAKEGEMPTKSDFAMSNFDDWVNNRHESQLTFTVSPSEGDSSHEVAAAAPQQPPMQPPTELSLPLLPGQPPGRRTSALLPLPNNVGDAHCVAGVGRVDLNDAACNGAMFKRCTEDCGACMECSPDSQDEEEQCSGACASCNGDDCTVVLSACAGSVDCDGQELGACKRECTACMACVDSNDAECAKCTCCSGCFPIVAKCNRGVRPKHIERRVYIGLYNHRRYHNRQPVVKGHATLQLRPDLNYDPLAAKSESWLAKLYDPFHDLQSIGYTMQDLYPSGQRFLYSIEVVSGAADTVEVKLFKDRLTLLHIKNEAHMSRVSLSFTGEMEVTHVLSSTDVAPKTFFDFDRQHQLGDDGSVKMQLSGDVFWCALFAGADGDLVVNIKTHSQRAPNDEDHGVEQLSDDSVSDLGSLLDGGDTSGGSDASATNDVTASKKVGASRAGAVSELPTESPERLEEKKQKAALATREKTTRVIVACIFAVLVVLLGLAVKCSSADPEGPAQRVAPWEEGEQPPSWRQLLHLQQLQDTVQAWFAPAGGSSPGPDREHFQPFSGPPSGRQQGMDMEYMRQSGYSGDGF